MNRNGHAAPHANGTAPKSKRPKSLKAEVAEAELRVQLRKLQLTDRLLESVNPYGDKWGRIVPPRNVQEPEWQTTGTDDAETRMAGSHPVAFANEQEHAEMRSAGRWLADSNLHTCGILGGITDYVIGKGFAYHVVAKPIIEVPAPQLQLAQDVIDDFRDREFWWDWERELFKRDRREGEHFSREFQAAGGITKFRVWEPEQFMNPSGVELGGDCTILPDGTILNGWRDEGIKARCAYGVFYDPDDELTILGYNYCADGDATKGVFILGDKIRHTKINVDRIVKRGLSDFFVVSDEAEDLAKLRRNVRMGASVLAAIAWIESHTTASKADVETFADNIAQYTQSDPANGSTIRKEKVAPGTVVRTGSGKEYKSPPLAQNTMNFVEIVRMGRQSLCARWRAPESLTGDASNGTYASLGVAESPFIHAAEVEQQFYAWRYRDTMRAVLQWAAKNNYRGMTPQLLAAIDVKVEPPKLVSRDPLSQSQVDEIDLRNGLVSPYTLASEKGRDLDEELKETERAKEAGWAPPAQAGAMAGPPASPGFVLPQIPESRPGLTVAEVENVIRRVAAEMSEGRKPETPTEDPAAALAAKLVTLHEQHGEAATNAAVKAAAMLLGRQAERPEPQPQSLIVNVPPTNEVVQAIAEIREHVAKIDAKPVPELPAIPAPVVNVEPPDLSGIKGEIAGVRETVTRLEAKVNEPPPPEKPRGKRTVKRVKGGFEVVEEGRVKAKGKKKADGSWELTDE